MALLVALMSNIEAEIKKRQKKKREEPRVWSRTDRAVDKLCEVTSRSQLAAAANVNPANFNLD